MSARMPAVAGTFYPAKRSELEAKLDSFFSRIKPEKKARAVIAPHAGYAFSGRIAAMSLSKLKKCETFVILGPNHTALGPRMSVSLHSRWVTPLGSVPVNKKIAEEIVEKSPVAGIAEFDELAHLSEHSIEVQLPFLQYLFDGFTIVPITIMTAELNELKALGDALYKTAKKHGVGIIASSDFSHFITLESAKERDQRAIDLIKALKIDEFHRLATGINASICGFGPITALMEFCKKAGIKKAKLLKYTTSADTTGDELSVVGYAAIVFKK